MITFRVRSLDAMIAQLTKAGVKVVAKQRLLPVKLPALAAWIAQRWVELPRFPSYLQESVLR